MSRTLYLDLASGASGDMLIACLADAGRRVGIDVEGIVTSAVDGLGLGCSVTFVDDTRGGLACRRAEVKTGRERLSPAELRAALDAADLAAPARTRARAALALLIEAEARVHGCAPEDVHLHELASPDTAADLAGVSAAVHALAISTLRCAPVPVPSGWMDSAHGPLPLPAPVTIELLRGAVLRGDDAGVELVTPTAAALLAAHGATFGPAPTMTLEGVGVGGGTRDLERPNVCRALVGRPVSGEGPADAVLLETNIDDQTPETLGHAVGVLLRSGALDAWITPVVMKKSRPGFLLGVLTDTASEAVVVEALFRHTSTLGVRRREVSRWTLERSTVEVGVDAQTIRVKVGRYAGEIVNVAPEFEDCAAAAARLGAPVDDVMHRAAERARGVLSGAPAGVEPVD